MRHTTSITSLQSHTGDTRSPSIVYWTLQDDPSHTLSPLGRLLSYIGHSKTTPVTHLRHSVAFCRILDTSRRPQSHTGATRSPSVVYWTLQEDPRHTLVPLGRLLLYIGHSKTTQSHTGATRSPSVVYWTLQDDPSHTQAPLGRLLSYIGHSKTTAVTHRRHSVAFCRILDTPRRPQSRTVATRSPSAVYWTLQDDPSHTLAPLGRLLLYIGHFKTTPVTHWRHSVAFCRILDTPRRPQSHTGATRSPSAVYWTLQDDPSHTPAPLGRLLPYIGHPRRPQSHTGATRSPSAAYWTLQDDPSHTLLPLGRLLLYIGHSKMTPVTHCCNSVAFCCILDTPRRPQSYTGATRSPSVVYWTLQDDPSHTLSPLGRLLPYIGHSETTPVTHWRLSVAFCCILDTPRRPQSHTVATRSPSAVYWTLQDDPSHTLAPLGRLLLYIGHSKTTPVTHWRHSVAFCRILDTSRRPQSYTGATRSPSAVYWTLQDALRTCVGIQFDETLLNDRDKMDTIY